MSDRNETSLECDLAQAVPALDVRGVSFRYPRAKNTVLTDVTFHVQPGELVGLIGPNGSGKSTLIRTMFDIYAVQSGSIFVLGVNHADSLARMQSLYLSTNDDLPGFLTGEEYVQLFAQMYGVEIDATRFSALLKRYGLSGREHDLIEDYSHGMQKKLQLIVAFLLRAPLTVIDETLNGIDIESLFFAAQDLRDLCDEGHAALLCTHDFAMLERVADRVVLLYNGCIVEDLTVSHIRNEYGSIENLTMEVLGVEWGDDER